MSQVQWGLRDGRALVTGEKLALDARQAAEVARSRLGILLVEAETYQDMAAALQSNARLLAATAEEVQENGYPDLAATFRERSLAAMEEAAKRDELARACEKNAQVARDAMFAAIKMAEQLSFPSDAVSAQEHLRPHQSQVAGAAKAVRTLEFLGTMVPKRINSEEIGDALERIHRLVAEGRPSWFIYLTVAKVFFWVSAHTAMEKFVGVVKIAMGQGHDRG